MPDEIKQQLFSVSETSTILGCSASSTWRAIREKRLKVIYIGGSTKVTRESLDALLAGAPKPERPYLKAAHDAANAFAKAKAAANLARKQAEAKRLAAVEQRKPKAKAERRVADAV
ncbi:MAG TPA: helix-turn-helix domain-containing protein [Roseiarcus sp.]|jgi:hypothetical protein|nr:helix-turn-helix domain-containing protein [Roseiarcus sp.]